ncbi:MAG: Na+/H+ antiporter NhaC family protein [Planctomycetota bacterium]
MPDHPFGWLSIAPPLATVVLAIVTKRAIASLLAGIFVGALILAQGNVGAAAIATFETHLWPTFVDPFKLRVLGFTLLMGATIGVVNRSGGMHGLVQLIAPLAKTRRRGQLVTWMAGLFVFFDDYTNTLLLGATMRPTCDRLRISREKLAYIVDSTAAPVAGLALLSTWVAIEIQFIQDGLDAAQPEIVGELTAVGIFLGCLPYRFYITQALLFVPLLAIVGRDFGPMRHAEQAAIDSATQPAGGATSAAPNPAEEIRASHWTNAVVPLATTLAVVVVLLIATGRAACEANEMPQTLRNVFGQADSALALFYGSLAGLIVASLMAVGRRLMPVEAVSDAAYAGVRSVLPALLILWFASTLSGMTRGDHEPGVASYPNTAEQLYTGDFLQSLLPMADDGKSVSPAVAVSLPTVIFLLASAVAFSTGTSFGTMGILLPVVAPIALLSLGPVAGDGASTPLLMATFGGVLSGAIFGDHCSPISDTTILSSQSSGCDHVAHVVTQLPYALTVALVSIALGTAPLAMGVSVWILLPLQTTALVGIALLLGKPIEERNEKSEE